MSQSGFVCGQHVPPFHMRLFGACASHAHGSRGTLYHGRQALQPDCSGVATITFALKGIFDEDAMRDPLGG